MRGGDNEISYRTQHAINGGGKHKNGRYEGKSKSLCVLYQFSGTSPNQPRGQQSRMRQSLSLPAKIASDVRNNSNI